MSMPLLNLLTERNTSVRRLVALGLFIFSSVSFAETRCDKQVLKTKIEQCYRQLVTERKEAIEEYYEAIMESSNIPKNVKSTIDLEYKNFMKNVFSYCPDNSCVEAAIMEQIKDMYEQTRSYTIPQ